MASKSLGWKSYGFEDFDMVHIPSPPDGNCLYHSICNAFYTPYRLQSIDGKYISRYDIVRQMRKELAHTLDQDHPNGNGLTRYEMMSNGEMKKLAQSGVKEYRLSDLRSWIDSDRAMGDEIISYIAEMICKNIVFLDSRTHDVYSVPMDYNTDWNFIVLLYDGSHFDLVGVRENSSTTSTHFTWDHPFILHLTTRMEDLKVAPR